MAEYDALFEPLRIKGLSLRNRVMSSSHAPGYVADGRPTERFIRYHAEKAKGGIGLTVIGSSTVAHDFAERALRHHQAHRRRGGPGSEGDHRGGARPRCRGDDPAGPDGSAHALGQRALAADASPFAGA